MNINTTWLTAIWLMLFACFICLLGILLTGCEPAYGDETPHAAVTDPNHAHYSIPHAHVHGNLIYTPTQDSRCWVAEHVGAAALIGLAIGVFVGLWIGGTRP